MMDRSSNSFSRRSWLLGAAAASALADAPPVRGSDPAGWTIAQAASELNDKRISSEELTKACFARIHKRDHDLNAFITLTEEPALQQARKCDHERASRKA